MTFQSRVNARAAALTGGERRPWYAVRNAVSDATVAEIDIYDEIDWYWGVSASEFRNELKALGDGVTTINLHINSPGGDVYEALAIMNTLRQHPARVVTTVDGLAASSAGFIAVGASDELVMAGNSEIMAHLPWALVVGPAADMRKMADDLDRIGANVASIFAARAGGSVDDWMSVLTAETWWSAQEAVDVGIADRVLATGREGAAQNRFDLSVFNHQGRSNAPAPMMARTKIPPSVETEATQRKEPVVALSESTLRRLGLEPDADDSAIDAAIAALPDPGDTAPAEPTIEQAVAVAARHDLTVLDKAAHEQLLAQAREGAEARAQQLREQDDATIRDALASGRITPASEPVWRASLAKDRDGAKALLSTLAENKAIAVGEIGHGVGAEVSNLDLGWFDSAPIKTGNEE